MLGAISAFPLRRQSSKSLHGAVNDFMEDVEEQGTYDKKKLVELWQRSSGLHTVEDWVTN